jgi:hypothetical protein
VGILQEVSATTFAVDLCDSVLLQQSVLVHYIPVFVLHLLPPASIFTFRTSDVLCSAAAIHDENDGLTLCEEGLS